MMKFVRVLIFITSFVIKATSQEFGVSPMTVYFSGNLGETIVKTITITNYSEYIDTFSLFQCNYNRDFNSKLFFNDSINSKYSIHNYLTTTKSFFSIVPKDSIKIDLLLSVTDSINSDLWGGYYLKSTQENKQFYNDNENNTQFRISPQIAIKLNYINKTLINKNDIEIKSLQISKEKESVIIEFINKSQKIIKGNIILNISNIKSQNEKEFISNKIEIFPNQTQQSVIKIYSPLRKGKYSVTSRFNTVQSIILTGKQEIISVN